MATIQTRYLGNLRTESQHLQSGNKLITDAPVDNHGRGEAFSPTDLLATSLGTCMLTTMAIIAEAKHIAMAEATCDITKVMVTHPRRVGEIIVHIVFAKNTYTAQEKGILEHAALNCPVYQSLHPDLKKTVSITF